MAEVLDPYVSSSAVDTYRQTLAGPDEQPLAIAGFYHMNVGPVKEAGYAEADDRMVDRLAEESYLPILTVFNQHPEAKILAEASGNTLRFLARRHLPVIDLMRELYRQHTFIPVLGTFTNPLPLITRPDVYRHQVTEALAIHHDLFGDVAPEPATKYDQEYFYSRQMMGTHDDFRIKQIVAWVDHVAVYLPVEEQQRYKAGGFIQPRWIYHSQGPTYVTPVSGHYIHEMRKAAEQDPTDATSYIQLLESFLKFNTTGNGILIFGPGDAEYNGNCTPLGDKWLIRPAWYESFFKLVAQSLCYWKDPVAHLTEGHPYEGVDLGDGGSRETTDVWTGSLWNKYIIERSNEALTALDQLALLISQTEDPAERKAYTTIYNQAQRAYDFAITSDALGYNPINARKDAAIDNAETCIGLCEPVLKEHVVWQREWQN